jgi:hypothetical protein
LHSFYHLHALDNPRSSSMLVFLSSRSKLWSYIYLWGPSSNPLQFHCYVVVCSIYLLEWKLERRSYISEFTQIDHHCYHLHYFFSKLRLVQCSQGTKLYEDICFNETIKIPFAFAFQDCWGWRITVPVPLPLIDEPIIYLL